MEFVLGPLLMLLILGGVGAAVVIAIRKGRAGVPAEPAEGGDYLAYILLALAVGWTAFSFSQLGRAAFPARDFLFGGDETLAVALAGTLVAGPIAFFLWRRQSRRRAIYPRAGGWTVYLAAMEAVFLVAFIIAAAEVIEWVLQSRSRPHWTDAVVFGAMLAFHEWAIRKTPPGSGEAELSRVLGSAIGLVATAIGVGGVLLWIFNELYATLAPVVSGDEFATPLALLIVGAPVWWYRWLRPWGEERSAARKAWLAAASLVGLATAIGAAVVIVSQTAVYLLGDPSPAGTHFQFMPAVGAVGVVALLVWSHHVARVGPERDDVRRAYEYSLAALGLGAAVGFATVLSASAFRAGRLVGPGPESVITTALALVSSALLWWVFWSRAAGAPREAEAKAGARRAYLLGGGVVAGLTSAGSLIATLVGLFQRLLNSGDASIVTPASLFVFAGLATWHLLRTNATDKALLTDEEAITPFRVTVICSDPGPLQHALPTVATVSVIPRGDDAGVVDSAMADAIAAAVATNDSLVWVDQDGFKVAPAG